MLFVNNFEKFKTKFAKRKFCAGVVCSFYDYTVSELACDAGLMYSLAKQEHAEI